MTSIRSRLLLGGALAAVTLLSTVLVPGTASAVHHPGASLVLTLRSSEGAHMVRLQCRPAGGSHPSARPACDELTLAAGDFDALPGSPEIMACTMEYRPIVASARGYWEGRPVRWNHKYSNPCTLRADTGAVFDFKRRD
jgi:hypothetical protein